MPTASSHSLVEPRSDIFIAIWHHFVVFVHDVALQQDDVNLRVAHSLHEDGHDARQVGAQHLGTHRRLGQRQPELARLERHRLVGVLRPHEHVLDDVWKVREQAIETDVQQHDKCPANVLLDVGVFVGREVK